MTQQRQDQELKTENGQLESSSAQDAPGAILALPWREIPGESAHDRTTRWLHAVPEVRDRVAYNLWCHERGVRNTPAERAAWATMSEEEREAIRCEGDRKREEYAAMSPEWQREAGRRALRRTLAINDEAT